MRQEMPTTTHLLDIHFVERFSFRRLIRHIPRQIDDFIDGRIAHLFRQLLLTHLLGVISILVGDDGATRKTSHWYNHGLYRLLIERF